MHDFTNIIEYRPSYVTFRQPNLASEIFSAQFSSELWLYLMAMLFCLLSVMTGMLWVLNTSRRKEGKKEARKLNFDTDDPKEFKAIDSLSWIFGECCKFHF